MPWFTKFKVGSIETMHLFTIILLGKLSTKGRVFLFMEPGKESCHLGAYLDFSVACTGIFLI